MRISDWSSDVCSSDLSPGPVGREIIIARGDVAFVEDVLGVEPDRIALIGEAVAQVRIPQRVTGLVEPGDWHLELVRQAAIRQAGRGIDRAVARSEEHTSELQSLMRNSYAVFCLK